MEVEADIEALGVKLIWVLAEDRNGTPGTAQRCRDFVDSFESERGLCVGDGETEPSAGVFDASPLAVGRGFDIIVERKTMNVSFQTTHGTPGGNDNLTAEQLLDEIRNHIDG